MIKKCMFFCLFLFLSSCSTSSPHSIDLDTQKGFLTPEGAIQALIVVSKEENNIALDKLFGINFSQKISSGDPVQDRQSLNRLHQGLTSKIELLEKDTNTLFLQIGQQEYIFPVPLINVNGLWYFDGQVGIEELVNRRIGHNEITAIKVLKFFIEAQVLYASKDRDNDGQREYATRLLSTPGKKDGLYWDFGIFDEPSPLGPQTAKRIKEHGDDAIYQGYKYKILISPDKELTELGSVRLFATPTRREYSGVMSFITHGDGKVYQKLLGNKEGFLNKQEDLQVDSSWEEVRPEDY